MSELLLPGVATANGVPRRFADAELERSIDRTEWGGTYLRDDLPVQLRELGSANVLGARGRVKVFWVHARRVLAEMVKNESLRNRADVHLVDCSVGAVLFARNPDGAVTAAVLPRSIPDPAGSIVSAVGDCPEVRRDSLPSGSHASAMAGEKTARLTFDESLASEGTRRQIGFFAASALTEHPLSISKGG